MRLILISGNGTGAGKTTLAEMLGGIRKPLAYSVRKELARIYPEFTDLIHSTKQSAKSLVLPSGKTIRQELVELGQNRCQQDSEYWCKKWGEEITSEMYYTLSMGVVVDDVRKKLEIDFFRKNYPGCVHFHIKYPGAVAEKNQDGSDVFDDLEEYADYVIARK